MEFLHSGHVANLPPATINTVTQPPQTAVFSGIYSDFVFFSLGEVQYVAWPSPRVSRSSIH